MKRFILFAGFFAVILFISMIMTSFGLALQYEGMPDYSIATHQNVTTDNFLFSNIETGLVPIGSGYFSLNQPIVSGNRLNFSGGTFSDMDGTGLNVSGIILANVQGLSDKNSNSIDSIKQVIFSVNGHYNLVNYGSSSGIFATPVVTIYINGIDGKILKTPVIKTNKIHLTDNGIYKGDDNTEFIVNRPFNGTFEFNLGNILSDAGISGLVTSLNLKFNTTIGGSNIDNGGTASIYVDSESIKAVPGQLVHQENNCDPSQIIMKLYTGTNSHGALWNTAGNNLIDICYNQIFGHEYTGANPHESNGRNKILGLYQDNNSHAEIPEDTDYGVNVSYGNLICRSSTGDAEPGEQLIVSLYQNTNSHISNGTDYSVHIYCKPAGTAYWENYEGNKITKSYIGNWVKLVAQTGLPAGTDVTFEISKKNGGLWGLLDKSIGTLDAKTNANGDAIAEWAINNSLFDSGENSADFKFTASNSNSGFSMDSGDLEIENYKNNTKPKLEVLSPEQRQVYFASEPLLFNATCSDKEGPVSINWKIIDTETGNVLFNKVNNSGFNYAFKNKGEKEITVRCSDQQGEYTENNLAILEIASPGIFAYINDPYYHESIWNNNLQVNYSANDSYVLDNTIPAGSDCSTGEIKCLAGNCPVITKNHPASCSSDQAIKNTPLSFEKIYFNWTFDDGYNVGGKGKVNGSRIYGIPSEIENDKNITLEMSYNNSVIGKLSTEVDREFSLYDTGRQNPGCMRSLGVDIIDEGSGDFNTLNINSPGGCVGPKGKAEGLDGGDDCCPVGFVCSAQGTSNSQASCVRPPVIQNITSCGDYQTKTMCVGDPAGVGTDSNNPEYSANPACGPIVNGSVVQCHGCMWNGTQENTGNCMLNKTLPSVVPPVNPNCTPSSCLTGAKTLQSCSSEGGYKKVQISKTFNPGNCLIGANSAQGSGCISEVKNVKCVEGVRLPFFGWEEFIVAIGFIALLYLVLLRYKFFGK